MYRFVKKVVKVLLATFLLLVVVLFFLEIRLPRSLVKRICRDLSNESVQVRCDGIGFGLKRGLSLRNISICDPAHTNENDIVAEASSASFDFLRQKVVVIGARYPRLPDSYYLPECHERNEPIAIDLPDLPDFRLELERPDILGLAPDHVTAHVRFSRNLVAIDEIHVEWPGDNQRVTEDGYFRLDFAEQRAHGEVRGVATQRHIRPLMLALDIPSAMPYFDAFTDVPSPVNASGEFDVNLVNCDFKMDLNLRPEMGRYNNVPMSRAEGNLDLFVWTRGTNCNVNFRVDLPVALDTKGRQLAGVLAVNCTNEFARLDYNVQSKLDFVDILRIADFICPETLDFVQCETPPEITAVGHTGTCIEDVAWNDLSGSARLWRGSIFGFKVRNLSLDYALERDTLSFANIRATGKAGGSVHGEAKVFMPDFDEDGMSFEVTLDHEGGSLDELVDIFDFDLKDRDGSVDAHVELSGPISTNAAAHVSGHGSLRITNGHLLQMKIFAGLTEQLANWVPGVDYIVNQSQASMDFTATNGVFSTENLYIEGGLVSIKGWGTYDAGADDLDFTVRVQFMKKESFLGKLVHPVTWPFTKILLEFKATGSADAPKWDYISVIDRIF